MAADLEWRVLQLVSGGRVLVGARLRMRHFLEEVSLRDVRVLMDVTFVHHHAGGDSRFLKTNHRLVGVLFRSPSADRLIKRSTVLVAAQRVGEARIVCQPGLAHELA